MPRVGLSEIAIQTDPRNFEEMDSQFGTSPGSLMAFDSACRFPSRETKRARGFATIVVPIKPRGRNITNMDKLNHLLQNRRLGVIKSKKNAWH
jgi:hypothetical protein